MCKKYLKVTSDYPDKRFRGLLVVELKRELGFKVLVGLPLDNMLGWYDIDTSTEYRCLWILEDYLEPITTITRSKFK